MGKKQREAAAATLAGIPPDEGRVILAAGKYIGEGFDDPPLDTLFLTFPVSWRGTVAQYVGRLHRLYDGKREVRVYDYADLNVPMLARMFDRRCRGYEAVGYAIVVPASAIPGWPADVPLPSDPIWKRDYAASVRRLVRDGVDVPLAELFVAAAHPVPSGAEGADRARSARKCSSTGGSRPWPKRTHDFGSMPISRFRSTERAAWKSICCAPMRASSSKSMARCIWPILPPTAAIGGRINCYRRRVPRAPIPGRGLRQRARCGARRVRRALSSRRAVGAEAEIRRLHVIRHGEFGC
jgi:hypothetical protein